MVFKAKYFHELNTSELYEILRSRSEIFMLEQRIVCQDMDGIDRISRHCFLEDDDRVVAYLRAYYHDADASSVRIGRVLTLTHGIGSGRILMQQSLADLKKQMKCKKLCINAQKHAIGFYEKFGFRVASEEFLEEGVVHVAMEMEL